MRRSPFREKGAALLALLGLLIVAAGYLLLTRINATDLRFETQFDTRRALAGAKAALLGQAVASPTRPGELPCPDRTGDGIADACTGTGPARIGRLPTVTLQLDAGRDETGETFWYALDRAFDATAGMINSDTVASLHLDGESVVAVILAPGAPVGTQSRPPSAVNNVARYLEDDNADGDADFVSHAAGDFNDRVIAITRDELMQAVERRVLGEAKRMLVDYFDPAAGANRFLPFADGDFDGKCESGTLQGWFPLQLTDCGLPDWHEPLPGWFAANGWHHLVWYALSDYCQQGTHDCADTGTGTYLTLNGVATPAGKHALLVATGAALPAQNRTVPAPPPVTAYLDKPENQNLDAVFERYAIDAACNDQIIEVTTP